MAKKGIGDIFTGILISAGKSLVTSELKKQAKGIIGARFAKTPEKARREAASLLGYETDHFTMDKKENIVFKPSPVFVHEWLLNSPHTSGKVLKDEENGQVFFEENPLTNAIKVDLMAKFSKATGLKNASVPGHFESAFKLLDPTDFTSIKFEREFAGWDASRPSLIDSFLPRAFGDDFKTPKPLVLRLFRKWMIGTTRRAMHPGSSHDGCLVLKGPGNIGKTRFFRNLLPPPFDHRTGEILGDIKDPKKLVENIMKKTIVNFDELSVLDYEDTHEVFKQFLSMQFVDVRLAWARKVGRYALRQGFAGTTNRDKFIEDKFLSRRLWVVELNEGQRLDFDFLFENRKDLWKEAVYLAEKGESCLLTLEDQRDLELSNKAYE